jgi:hypothetical protein
VVKEGRILHLVSGDIRIVVNTRIIQGVAGLILAYLHSISESYNVKNCNSFLSAWFTPGFGEESGVLVGKFIGLVKKLMRRDNNSNLLKSASALHSIILGLSGLFFSQ